MNKWLPLEYISNWHSYWQVDGIKITHDTEYDLMLGQTVYKARAIIEEGMHQGKGGMSESYSWEDLFFEIRVDEFVEIRAKKGMKIRQRIQDDTNM